MERLRLAERVRRLDGDEERGTPTRRRRRERRELIRRRLRERLRRRNARRPERRRNRIVSRPERRNDARRRALDRAGNRVLRVFERATKRRLDVEYFELRHFGGRRVDNLRLVARERLRRFPDREPSKQIKRDDAFQSKTRRVSGRRNVGATNEVAPQSILFRERKRPLRLLRVDNLRDRNV